MNLNIHGYFLKRKEGGGSVDIIAEKIKRTGRDRSSKNLSYIYERYIWPTKPFWKLHSLSHIVEIVNRWTKWMTWRHTDRQQFFFSSPLYKLLYAHIFVLWTASFWSSQLVFFFFLLFSIQKNFQRIKRDKKDLRGFYSHGSHISVMVVNAR